MDFGLAIPRTVWTARSRKNPNCVTSALMYATATAATFAKTVSTAHFANSATTARAANLVLAA